MVNPLWTRTPRQNHFCYHSTILFLFQMLKYIFLGGFREKINWTWMFSEGLFQHQQYEKGVIFLHIWIFHTFDTHVKDDCNVQNVVCVGKKLESQMGFRLMIFNVHVHCTARVLMVVAKCWLLVKFAGWGRGDCWLDFGGQSLGKGQWMVFRLSTYNHSISKPYWNHLYEKFGINPWLPWVSVTL